MTLSPGYGPNKDEIFDRMIDEFNRVFSSIPPKSSAAPGASTGHLASPSVRSPDTGGSR